MAIWCSLARAASRYGFIRREEQFALSQFSGKARFHWTPGLRWLAAALALSAAALAAGPVPSVYSQTSIELIDVVGVDYSTFPDVAVQARVVGASLLPVEMLTPDAIILTENGIEQPYELQSTDAGTQVALVVDLGAGSDARGASGEARYLELEQLLLRYIDSMGSKDQAMIILQNEDGVQVLQQMTGSKDALRAAASGLAPNFGVQTNGLASVQQALEDLESLYGAATAQAVLYLTTGVQNAISPGYDSVSRLARDLGIPVYVLLSNTTDILYAERLGSLADSTGGRYAFYRGPADPATAAVFETLDRLRTQFIFRFRSINGTNAERTIVLQARGGGSTAPQDFATYTVTLEPPRVVFDLPAPGSEIARTARTWDELIDSVEPTSTTISIHVEWDDGYPRNISSAQLYINNEEVGAPILDVDPEATLNFPWDLRTFRTPGENVVQIQVRVIDELGLGANRLSDTLLATVIVSIPAPPTPEGQQELPTCDLEMGFVEYVRCMVITSSGLVALLLAIPTLIIAIIAWRNKGQIVQTVGRAQEAVTEFVARVTRPADTGKQAAAYITVLRGDPYLLGKKFPIHASTVTPIGRDKSQVEIVFPDEENSVISRKHCEIRQEDGIFKLRDFASTYGTYLNGVRLPELGVEVLHHDDEIALGPVERGGILLRFELALTDEDMPDEVRDTQPP
jgi:hypothetical protein